MGRVWPLAWVHDHTKKARTAVYAQLVDAVLPPDASGRDAGYEDAGKWERRWTELAEAEILLASCPRSSHPSSRDSRRSRQTGTARGPSSSATGSTGS